MTKVRSISSLFALCSLLALNVNAQEVKANYNGLTVNANMVLAEGKTLADEVVLLTHGTTTHNGRETYITIQDLLAENGISSIAPNLSLNVNDRHGEVDCSLPQSHQHHDSMKEIDFWLQWLASKGSTGVTLMGHSRGGNQTAWYSVEQDSDLIKNVVLIAPQVWSEEAAIKQYEKKYKQSYQPLLTKAQNLVKEGKGDSQLNNINFIYCKGTTVTAAAFVSYYQPDERMDTPTLLKKATKPTLVIIGSADKAVVGLEGRMVAVHNDHVTSYVIDDADHFFMDFFAEELVEEVVTFIQQ